MVMFCTASSTAGPPPCHQYVVSAAPDPPSRWARVPWPTLVTARSASAIPRSTGAGNMRWAYWISWLLGVVAHGDPPEVLPAAGVAHVSPRAADPALSAPNVAAFI